MKRKSWKGKQNSPIPYRAPKYNRTSRLERIKRVEQQLNIGIEVMKVILTPFGYSKPKPEELNACSFAREQLESQIRSEVVVLNLPCQSCNEQERCNPASAAGRLYHSRPSIKINRYGGKTKKGD